MTCRYIAVLSSQITVTSINLNINGLSDLATKPVGIFQVSCWLVVIMTHDAQTDVPDVKKGMMVELAAYGMYVWYPVLTSGDSRHCST